MDFSTTTVDLAPIFALAMIVIPALLTLMPIRKGIKLSNRS